jgi:prenyltransferase beta subunit
MRLLLALALLPAVALAQTADEKKATLKFIESLRDPETGAWAVSPPKDGEKLKPSLRAVNGAVNAIPFFGGEVTDKEKLTKFVMSCFDEKTGTFAEPGEKATVASTCVGLLAAKAVGVPKEKYQKAMAYIDANAKSFEDYRLGAAAIEAFGVHESGIDVDRWVKAAETEAKKDDVRNGRMLGSRVALALRLGHPYDDGQRKTAHALLGNFQADDGGWAKPDAKTSDADTTYRVMRAFHLIGRPASRADGVAKFVAGCRRPDGGYGVDATAPSSMSGTYYAAKILGWLK